MWRKPIILPALPLPLPQLCKFPAALFICLLFYSLILYFPHFSPFIILILFFCLLCLLPLPQLCRSALFKLLIIPSVCGHLLTFATVMDVNRFWKLYQFLSKLILDFSFGILNVRALVVTVTTKCNLLRSCKALKVKCHSFEHWIRNYPTQKKGNWQMIFQRQSSPEVRPSSSIPVWKLDTAQAQKFIFLLLLLLTWGNIEQCHYHRGSYLASGSCLHSVCLNIVGKNTYWQKVAQQISQWWLIEETSWLSKLPTVCVITISLTAGLHMSYSTNLKN